MFRIILSTLGVSALMLSASSAATAHPHETVETQTKPSKKAEFKMPSEADIEDIIDKMPNINGIMGDLTDVLKDENLREVFLRIHEGFRRV
jgi:pyruvate kinase